MGVMEPLLGLALLGAVGLRRALPAGTAFICHISHSFGIWAPPRGGPRRVGTIFRAPT